MLFIPDQSARHHIAFAKVDHMVEEGKKAPDFLLASTSGGKIFLKDLRGKPVVLYFYPKDSTPGCTQEACDFRDNFKRIEKCGAVVFGVSKDSLASHDTFRDKQQLPFELLCDPENKVALKFGAYGEKKMYGKIVTGTIRSTFLIDSEGKVAKKWSPVRVKGHVDKVLAALEALDT